MNKLWGWAAAIDRTIGPFLITHPDAALAMTVVSVCLAIVLLVNRLDRI